MQEEWREIIQFPKYSVSNTGLVRNDVTGSELTRHVNQRGIANVSLSRNKTQYKRSLAVLVANAFITTARPLAFDTPINRNGDRLDNRVDNLLWRPRWHAVDYFRQFIDRPRSIDRPIVETKTGEVFKSSWEAAIHYGLLDTDIVAGIVNSTYVRPTFQVFRLYV
jgi:hypothetical protein